MPGLKLGDIYYVLFRHKWKILLSALLGIGGAAWFFFVEDPLYISEAKLLVRYVRDLRTIDSVPGAGQGQLRSPDRGGDSIINSELEILTSRDLAEEVAGVVGPQRILGPDAVVTNAQVAATVLLKGLLVEAPRRSSVIRITYTHPDPLVARETLHQLIQSYLRMHLAVHRSVGLFDNFLNEESEKLRSRLRVMEDDLRELLLEANVTSVDEARAQLASRMARLRDDLMTTETELAERRAFIAGMGGTSSNALSSPISSPPTNAVATAEIDTTETSTSPLGVGRIDSSTEEHYRSVLARLDALRNHVLDLQLQFTSESARVRNVRQQIAEVEKTKAQLEAEEPRLVELTARVSPMAIPGSSEPLARSSETGSLAAVEVQIAALAARTNALHQQLELCRADLAKLIELEPDVAELQRQRSLAETNYIYFSAGLEQARLNESLGAGDSSNINIVENATVALPAKAQRMKIVAMILFAGVGGGLGWAFLIELVLSQTLKRPEDLERKLGLPLFLTIPEFSRNGYAKPKKRKQLAAPPPDEDDSAQSPPDGPPTTPMAVPEDPADAYHEALRDRLIMHFQIKELTHKPKLVGITGATSKAGASWLAAGLAKSLSETGDGSVLLVDMNLERGPSVHPFHRGKATCCLTDAFEQGKCSAGMVQDNLYVASVSRTSGTNGGGVGVVPTKFASLIPKMKASDYDYIIFDLPPVSQTSVTAKVAGLLDVTALVIDSERTNAELASRSASLLAESRANVCTVLNRYRDYLPKGLRNHT
jgi:uncharacterized protein involved in exopolysaccharide biosynthesis/Mrp family chromosome partitioning ATPase